MLSLAIFVLALSVGSGVNGAYVEPYGGSKYPYGNKYGQYPVSGSSSYQSPPPKQGYEPVQNIGDLVRGVRYIPSPPERLVPVRLTSEVAEPATFPLLKISVNKYAKLYSLNDGNLVFSVAAGKDKVATLVGGPSKNTYEFGLLAQNQVYDTPNARSSTTEDDVGFPAQIQLFLYNTAYYNFTNAINYSDGLIIFPFNILPQGTVPNKKAQPYVDLLNRLQQPNSTSYIYAYEALEWLLTSLEPDYYVYPGSYIDFITLREYPCATLISPNFDKHPYVSKPQYKSFTSLVNRNYQPEINPIPLYPLAGRKVYEANYSPVIYNIYD